MNPGKTSKITVQTFRYYFCRFLYAQQNVNKSSSIYIINCQNKNEKNYSPCSAYSKHFRKPLCLTPTALYVNIQRRNITNEAFDKLPKSSSGISIADEAAKLASSNVSETARNISEWKIVELAQNTLLKVHEVTGLPWWASIALTGLMARATVTLPFSIIQVRTAAKLELVKLEMDDIVKRLKHEANYACSYHGWPENLARKEYKKKVRSEWNDIIVRENCHPAKTYILMLIQIPLWFAFSFATRNLCYMLPKADYSAQVTYLELIDGGFGWVNNLTHNDPYFILPISLTLVNLAILEVHQLFRVGPPTKLDRWKKIFFRVLSVGMLPAAAFMPTVTVIYWLSSSMFGLIQAFLLNSLRLRRLFRVPVIKSELERPYRYFYSNLKSRLRLADK